MIMAIDTERKLHWTQRIALVRYNLHAARRTGDFTFFKTLQAHALIEGTDFVTTLNDVLGDDADTVSTLDNLNAGVGGLVNGVVGHLALLRCVDALLRFARFQAVSRSEHGRFRAVVDRLERVLVHVCDPWITGTTIIADAVKVCLDQMDSIELYVDDFIRLEYAWSSIQNSVDAAVSALRGIFSLMANGSSRSRASSNASAAFGIIKRAFSHSHMLPPLPPPKVLRADSVFGAVTNPLGLRQSVSAACPTRIPHLPDGISHTPLAPVPPTPGTEECVNPFSFGEVKGEGVGIFS